MGVGRNGDLVVEETPVVFELAELRESGSGVLVLGIETTVVGKIPRSTIFGTGMGEKRRDDDEISDRTPRGLHASPFDVC